MNAQVCTPDTAYTQPGIWPDGTQDFDTAYQCEPYTQILTVIVPVDSFAQGFDLWIDSIVLTGIGGLPPGMTYECEPPSCTFPGGTTGCVLISGTSFITGIYNIVAYTTTYVRMKTFPWLAISQNDTITDYQIVVDTSLFVSTAVANASCVGVCDGTANVTPTGGTTPYTYLWSDSGAQTNAMATGLCSGSYNVIVTSANGCVDSSSVVITEPPLLTVSVSGSNNVTCNGDCDGDATATAGGGTGPYTYLWNDPGTQTTSTATGLCASTVIISVEDSLGCTATDSVVITQPVAVSVSIASSTDLVCNSICDGDATGSVTGGIGTYTYLWNDTGAQTTLMATGLCAGTYALLVTDSNGCTDVAVAVIAEPSALIVGITGSNDVTCNAGCDGDATGSASSGTSPLTYLWDDPGAETNLSVSNLCAGTFKFLVTDGNACMDSAMVVITEPSTVVASISGSSNATCNGECDGTATASASGGVGPYGYSWNDLLSQTTLTADSLCAGSYNVVATDTSGCADTANVVITEPTVITLTMASTDASCSVANGSASVSASGGTGTYSYLWNDPGAQTTDTATALNAGGYNVTVTDASGCSEVGVVSVNNVGAGTVSITSISNVTCNGANDGSAVVLASGGTLPYTYSWDDPGTQTTDTAVGLAGGTYVATVTDGAGCIASDIAVVLEPAALSLSTTSNDVTCSGLCDGDATVTVTGGTAPYVYIWNDTLSQTDSMAVTLCVGTYTVTVTDTNGCQDVATVTIFDLVALTATVSSTGPTCIGFCDGAATALAAGGTSPYTYLWTDSIGDTLALGGSIGGMCAGNYGLTITDGNGCVSSTVIGVVDPIGMTLSFASAPSTCGASDGAASVSITNGTAPYSYLWDDSGAQSTDTASVLAAGTYNVTVTDSSGCTVNGSVTVGDLSAPSVSITSTDVTCNGEATGSANTTIVGGSTPYTYSWDDATAQTTPNATGLTAGTYLVSVTDSNGCTNTASVTIAEPAAIVIDSETSTNPSCNGAGDDVITIVASGGTGPLTYSIDGGTTFAGSGTFTGQGGGTYNVVVMDSAGCVDSGSVLTITDPPAIVIDSVIVMNISCNGLTDASVVIYASGGTGALEYSIDGGTSYTNTSGSFTGLGAITVISAVRDSTMCEVVGNTYTITEPAVLSVSTSATMETGVGNADGTATAVASGGTSPYTYSWNSSPMQTTAIATGLTTGDYVVETTDANGCMSTDTVNVGLSIGIEDIVHNLAVKLYPNPAYTELNIEVNLSGDLTFMAYDVTGKQVLVQKIESGKSIVSLADLSTGLYVYRVSNTSGAALAHGKFSVLK